MENQYFITSHAQKQFTSRFKKRIGGKSAMDWFLEAVRISVAEERRDWIDYHYNPSINAIFVSDRITRTVITTFEPKDEIKYHSAINLSKSA